MVKQEVAITTCGDIKEAVSDLCSQLEPRTDGRRLILFMASSIYDFAALSREMKQAFPDEEVLGTTTSGEITKQGFSKNSIVLTALTADNTSVKGVLIQNEEHLAILSKKDIENAYHNLGFHSGVDQPEKGFGLLFVTGLKNAEESLLSLIYGIIDNPSFQMAGGSAGDDLKMQETFVSYNGRVTSNGGALVFIQTGHKFELKRERIHRTTGCCVTLTKTDINERKIIEINGEPALTAYAKALNVTVDEAKKMAASHPLGRLIGKHIFVSSIASCNDDGSLSMFSRALPGTKADILAQQDVLSRQRQTFDEIKANIPNEGFVFLFNCILRTVAFEQEHLEPALTTQMSEYFHNYCGFSSYGEIFNKMNINQSLVCVVIEDN